MPDKPEGPPPSFSLADWLAITDALQGDALEVAEISRLASPSSPDKPNVRVGLRALHNGVSPKDAKCIGTAGNLVRALDYMEDFRKECVARLKGIEEPTLLDVDLVFASTKLDIAQSLAAPLRGTAIKRLLHHLKATLSKTLYLLKAKLEDRIVHASDAQVDESFAAALDDVWKQKHRGRRYGIIVWQLSAMTFLALHGAAFSLNPTLGWCVLVAGILINAFLLLSIGTAA